MRRLVWSDDALDDLDTVLQYIGADSHRAVALTLDRIERSVNLLVEFPTGRPGRVQGTYEKPVTRSPYIIAYSLSETRLTILHVIHGARDWREGEWPAE